MSHYYCLVRKDISLADQICQVSHASLEAGKRFKHDEGCNLVLLGVQDQSELLQVMQMISQNSIGYFCHVEPDDDIGPAAICTQPVTKMQRNLFAGYRLWRP